MTSEGRKKVLISLLVLPRTYDPVTGALLGFAYGDEEIEGVEGSDYLLTGTLGYGVVATAFAGLAIVILAVVIDRITQAYGRPRHEVSK